MQVHFTGERLVLTIRRTQMDAFKRAALSAAEQRLCHAVQAAFPHDANRLGWHGTCQLTRLAIARAARHGVYRERDIFSYLASMMMLGALFDDDPQLAWSSDILESAKPPSMRMQTLYDAASDYLDRVGGRNNEYLVDMRSRMRSLCMDSYGDDSSLSNIVSIMRALYPQKAACHDQAGLLRICELGREASLDHGLSTWRDTAIFSILIFVFGCGVLQDPQFPWVDKALCCSGPENSKAVRLYGAALAFLEEAIVPGSP